MLEIINDKEITNFLRGNRRENNFYRIDEFVILATETNLHGGKVLAEKLRVAITEIQHLNICKITASFGVAQKRKMESFELWFKRVDIAMYNAKNNGGNCVETQQ